jgi:SAM-dependent methyltransferase
MRLDSGGRPSGMGRRRCLVYHGEVADLSVVGRLHPLGRRPGLSIRRYAQALRRRVRSHLVLFGTLRHTEPVNPAFGATKGTPVDRYYLDRYLADHAAFITGRVMEVGGSDYISRFGNDITTVDVLNRSDGCDLTTIVADLASCPQIPDDSFDCIVLTQTLQYVFDMRAAVAELFRITAPGGVVLCTVPGLSQISRYDMDRWGDRWRLTSLSAKELFATAFPEDSIKVETFGNALSALCFIEGIPAERLRAEELAENDPDYQILVAIRARKPR